MSSSKMEFLNENEFKLENGVWVRETTAIGENQKQTNDAFSEKWVAYDKHDDSDQEKLFNFQREWYLKLYGFKNEGHLADYLSGREVILDAGCGLGYKAAWFAELSPKSTVIAMDFSDSIFAAATRYSHLKNIVFIHGDIANTYLNDNVVSYVSCDQVIHHTDDPALTLEEFRRISAIDGEMALYVYAKKALPRELLDTYFREHTKSMSHDELWAMSEQLTELGRRLAALDVSVDVPAIPALGIDGGEMDIQRLVYWHFAKCFWNNELGWDTSVSTNFDWYSPSNAFRYSQDEFLQLATGAGYKNTFLHSEEACHSGRFTL